MMSDPTVPLFHRDLGGAGPPLVLLHGMLGSSRNWQTAGRELAARYRVFAPDLRNHGGSPHVADTGYPAMMGDVLRWMKSVKLEKATILGHSMGGKAAMLLACRHPGRVEKLVIVDIVPKDYRWAAHRDEFAAMNRIELGGLRSRADAEMRMEDLVPDYAMRKFLTTNLERDEAGLWRWSVNLPALTAALPILEKNPLDKAERYEGPVRFIIGGRSRYVLKEDWEPARCHFPRAEFIVLPDSGHNPHMDAREAFVRAVP
ncbi:MAG: alpha/beta fold hydrolase [Opitutaceae bacterium]